MSRLLPALLVIAFLFGSPLASPLSAQTEGLGIGASIGVTNGASAFDRNPVGLSVKAWISDRQAFVGATSFFIGDTTSAAPSFWLLQGDYLFHNFNELDVGEGYLSLYFGVGAQYGVFEGTENPFALRSPVGVTYLLGSAPVDVFVEVAPTVRITEPESLRFDGAIGFRYYFSSGSASTSSPSDTTPEEDNSGP